MSQALLTDLRFRAGTDFDKKLMNDMPSRSTKRVRILDPMCGAGGFILGFKMAVPESEIVAVDINVHACQTVHINLKDRGTHAIRADAAHLPIRPTTRFDVIIGGPPCQGFSCMNPYRFKSAKSKRDRDRIYVFARIVIAFRPYLFYMENVPGMLGFKDYVEKLRLMWEDAGWFVSVWLIDACDYGVPQNRRRVIFQGSIFEPMMPPPPTHGGYCPRCAAMCDHYFISPEPGFCETVYICPKCQFHAMNARKFDCEPWQTLRERLTEIKRARFRARFGDAAWQRIILKVNTSAEEESPHDPEIALPISTVQTPSLARKVHPAGVAV